MKNKFASALIVMVTILTAGSLFNSCSDDKEDPIPVESNFEVNLSGDTAPATVTITNKTTGADKYQWSFEGGNPESSDLKNPQAVTYTAGGEFTILLIASNDDNEDSFIKTIQIKKPELNVLFDLEMSGEKAPCEVSIENKTTGAAGYTWSFEGAQPASSTEQNPGKIIYNEPGNYTITLTATNGDQEKIYTREISVKANVVAAFEAELNNEFAPAELTLTNNSENGEQFEWTFEGGIPENSTEENPGKIVYNAPGEYTITLKVVNGEENDTKSQTITLKEKVNASFEVEINDKVNPTEVSITNNTTGATSFAWTFEGGTPESSTEKNPGKITYSTPGEYTITLVASNADDEQTLSQKLTIDEKPQFNLIKSKDIDIHDIKHSNEARFYSINKDLQLTGLSDRNIYPEDIHFCVDSRSDSQLFLEGAYDAWEDYNINGLDAESGRIVFKKNGAISASEFDNLSDAELIEKCNAIVGEWESRDNNSLQFAKTEYNINEVYPILVKEKDPFSSMSNMKLNLLYKGFIKVNYVKMGTTGGVNFDIKVIEMPQD